MRAQVVVLGPVEREMYVRLADDLLPAGAKHAEEVSWRIVGCGVEVSERLVRLGLSTAIVAGMGTSDEDKEVLATLRRRGVQTRGTRAGARATPVTVRVRTPRHELKMATAASTGTPSKQTVLRALPGCRHFHVCGSVLSEPRSLDAVASAIARAKSLGASTSLDAHSLPPQSDWASIRTLVARIDVAFADSETLRAMSGERRIGSAATTMLELGVSAATVTLGAGGSRVYSREIDDQAFRVPRFGREVTSSSSAFASGFLLGWLVGAKPEICGVIGASAALASTKAKHPDRRELAARLADARKNPLLRKLVPMMSEAGRLLDKPRRLPRRSLSRS